MNEDKVKPVIQFIRGEAGQYIEQRSADEVQMALEQTP